MGKTVCVIGAGISGLGAVKACLEEGLQPTCYESRRGVGGIWNYEKIERWGSAGVYQSLVTNVSKEASCFSDFPFPKEYTPFFSHTKFLEYLNSYAAHFDLDKHIFLNTKVENVVQTTGVDGETCKWKVVSRKVDTDTRKTEEFDCVIVCSGLDSEAQLPKTTGLSDGSFNGKVMHSCEYHTPEEFAGKKIVVIGLGNSGVDLAAEISDFAAATYLSSRSGSWILPRMFEKGLPPDMTATTRIKSFLRAIVPEFLGSWFTSNLLNSFINHDRLGIRSRFGPMETSSRFLINDEISSKIFSGKVRVKPNLIKLSGNEAVFSDDSKVEADVIVCATGYESKFSFISDEILPNCRAELRLFEWMIPFETPNPESLGVVGIFPPAGGLSATPVIECQVRYLAQIMSGVVKLPPVKNMRESFEEVRSSGDTDTVLFRTKLGFTYPDGVAKLGGFYPYFWQIFFRDPRLAIAVQFGPFLSYHYRLLGRYQWSGARDRILNVIPNTLAGLGSIYHRND